VGPGIDELARQGVAVRLVQHVTQREKQKLHVS
jgi:hypothetical protein